MIGIVAKLKIVEGKNAEFEQVGKDLMAKVKANEPGCQTYQLYQSQSDPQTYIFMEQYSNAEALESHGKTEYFKAAGPKMAACLAGRPEIERYDIVE